MYRCTVSPPVHQCRWHNNIICFLVPEKENVWSLMDLKKWSGDDSSWCLRDRGTNPDPGLLGGGPWAMAVLGIKRALHLTELSQGSPGLRFSVSSSFQWWLKGRLLDPHAVHLLKGKGKSSSWSSTSEGHRAPCSLTVVPWQWANRRVKGLESWVSWPRSQTEVPCLRWKPAPVLFTYKIKEMGQYLFSELVIKQLHVIILTAVAI